MITDLAPVPILRDHALKREAVVTADSKMLREALTEPMNEPLPTWPRTRKAILRLLDGPNEVEMVVLARMGVVFTRSQIEEGACEYGLVPQIVAAVRARNGQGLLVTIMDAAALDEQEFKARSEAPSGRFVVSLDPKNIKMSGQLKVEITVEVDPALGAIGTSRLASLIHASVNDALARVGRPVATPSITRLDTLTTAIAEVRHHLTEAERLATAHEREPAAKARRCAAEAWATVTELVNKPEGG